VFDSIFFKNNREKLAKNNPGELIVIAANGRLQSSYDLTFTFRQDSNFWYLTGIDEPDLVLVIDTKKQNSVLYLPKQSDFHKEWDGEIDLNTIEKNSGITKFAEMSELVKQLKSAKSSGLTISHLEPLDEIVQPYNFYSNPARRKLLNTIKKAEPKPKDIRKEIIKLRQVKQACEIEQMQKAIDITGKTLEEVRKRLKNYKSEAEITRDITVGFYKHGSDGHGYEPIVAGGKNAATIHYVKNDAKLQQGELVLLDVGAKTGYYSADISRTWSTGKPTKRQEEVYRAAIELQKKAFKLLKPGVILRNYQKTMENHAKVAMKKLGVKQDKYPHGFSHFIGLDVHDPGEYEKPLKENNLLTVEPGIYLPDENIGVRVEDIVRITKNGVEIMSKNIPKAL